MRTTNASTEKPVIQDLSKYLRYMFNSNEVFLTGRGATAIYVALKAIGKPDSYVAVPSFTCPSIPQAVLAAGMKPLFLNIRLEDFNLDASEIDFLPSNVSALIAPHMFGHPLEIEEIKHKCNKRNILLIEDIAQAFGEQINNRLLGTFGDVTIISFHQSKIISGRGGGALLVNSEKIDAENIKAEINKLPPMNNDFHFISRMITSKVNSLLNECRKGTKDTSKNIGKIYSENLDLIAFSNNPDDEAFNLAGVLSVEKNLQARKERAEKYRKLIEHPLIIHPSLISGTPLFRYSILIYGEDGARFCRLLTERLRINGIHASNLYFPAHLIFHDGMGRRLKNVEWVSERIINLWLDEIAGDGYIQKTADLILDFMEIGS